MNHRGIKVFAVFTFLINSFVFAQSKEVHGRLEYSLISDTIEQSAISKEFIDSIFTFVGGKSDLIDFEDCNICKSRAHIISGVIEKNFPGIRTGKAWLIADCRRKSKISEYRYRENIYLEHTGKCKSWGYHVAPVIITGTDTFVIDPATQNQAAKINDWAYKLLPETGKAYLVIKDSRYFIFPDDTEDLFEDEKLNWLDDDEITTDEHYSRSIDEVVRVKMGLVEPWMMRYHVMKLEGLVMNNEK